MLFEFRDRCHEVVYVGLEFTLWLNLALFILLTPKELELQSAMSGQTA